VETLLKESHDAKKSRMRKWNQDPRMPNKPNMKTRIKNQLRLNSKELFNPSLKGHQPIVIEYEDSFEFSNMEEMEEMVVHTLNKMIWDKEILKFCKG
jgi:hypothetical protein